MAPILHESPFLVHPSICLSTEQPYKGTQQDSLFQRVWGRKWAALTPDPCPFLLGQRDREGRLSLLLADVLVQAEDTLLEAWASISQPPTPSFLKDSVTEYVRPEATVPPKSMLGGKLRHCSSNQDSSLCIASPGGSGDPAESPLFLREQF